MAKDILSDITDSDWEKAVERNNQPVFVMFYSPSCPHCVRIMPSVEELARDYGTEVTFVKLNLLRFDYIGERYGVMATPSFFFFCGGRPVQTRVGAVFPAMLKKWLKRWSPVVTNAVLHLQNGNMKLQGMVKLSFSFFPGHILVKLGRFHNFFDNFRFFCKIDQFKYSISECSYTG